jgi:hypothetical protein
LSEEDFGNSDRLTPNRTGLGNARFSNRKECVCDELIGQPKEPIFETFDSTLSIFR